MATLFNDRERAAEGIFVHNEELGFLARRRGIEALATWAADGMGLGRDESFGYVATIVRSFVTGHLETDIARVVQTDLERAGKPALSTNVGIVLDRAVAEAREALRSAPAPVASDHRAADPRAEWERHHPASPNAWGWGL